MGISGVQQEHKKGLIVKLYLKDFEPFLVVLGDFVRSDQLNVVAVTRVAHYVVLDREKGEMCHIT